MERQELFQAATEGYYNLCILGIPTFGAVSVEFLERMFYVGRPMNFGLELKYVKGKEVAEARNELARYAVERKARYLLFVDDDVLIPSGAVPQLAQRLVEFDAEHTEKKGRNLVAGVYFAKGRPVWPLVFTQPHEPCDQSWYGEEPHLRECLFTGMGCTLIPTRAFEEIEEPWFHTPNEVNLADPWGPMIRGTEDAYFCAKARQAGWRIWADLSVQCFHFSAAQHKAWGFNPEARLPGELDMRTGKWTYYPPIGVSKAGPEVRNLKWLAEEERAEVETDANQQHRHSVLPLQRHGRGHRSRRGDRDDRRDVRHHTARRLGPRDRRRSLGG